MDWTEKCATCAKSGHLINQGIYFACFDDKCEYESLPEQEFYTASASSIINYNDEDEVVSYEETTAPFVIEYEEVNNGQTIIEPNLE